MLFRSSSKRIISLILIIIILAPIISISTAATSQNDAADKLHKLGLFQGVGANSDGTPNFDLDRKPTRHEAVTMLVRLIGKEDDAKKGEWDIPFTDVADWAKPYVGYAYSNGLTQGTGAETFSGNDTVTATQYITFVLRALGYVSGVDFKWDKAWELSDKLGFTAGEYKSETNNNFIRGNVANISFDALSAKLKNSNEKLYENLIESGVFTEEMALSVGLIEFIPAPDIMATEITLDITELTFYELGDTAQLNATIMPEDTTNKIITWTSSNTNVAIVSDSGLVTAVWYGNAEIKAVINGISTGCSVKIDIVRPTAYPNDYDEYSGIMDFLEIFPSATQTDQAKFFIIPGHKLIESKNNYTQTTTTFTYILPFNTKMREVQVYFDELQKRGFVLSNSSWTDEIENFQKQIPENSDYEYKFGTYTFAKDSDFTLYKIDYAFYVDSIQISSQTEKIYSRLELRLIKCEPIIK